MAAFVIAPLAKMAAAAFAWLLFRPREGANEGTREALDTSALDTLATSEPASTSATSIPLESDSEVASPVVNDDSAIAAARQLHAYVLRTPRSARDRVFIRARQAAMGGVTVDGLIGRQTAARIRELTGLRLPGLS